ncbi:MAG: hypothetical protein WCD36_10920 [Rhodanobacteraceae bacterium]
MARSDISAWPVASHGFRVTLQEWTSELWQRLKQHKLEQWVVAHAASAFALLQGTDFIAHPGGIAACTPGVLDPH